MEKAYMTDKVGCSLQDEMKQLHPEFTYCFTDVTKPPPSFGCRITRRTCNKTSVTVEWGGNETATCQLLMKGTQPHTGNQDCYFAITSAQRRK